MPSSPKMATSKRPITSEAELERLYAFVEGGYRDRSSPLWRRAARRARQTITRGRHPTAEPLRVTDFEHPTDAAFAPASTSGAAGALTFLLPVAWCRYPFGFGYGPGVWNPLQETAAQLHGDLEMHPDDTVLAAYFGRYQPKNLAELLFAYPERDVPRDAQLWQLSTGSHMDVLPWAHDLRPWPSFAPGQLDRNAGFGPAGHAILDLEVWRIRRLVASMAASGYRSRANDVVRGTFVSDGARHRFVLRAGFHRVAVAGALGVASIPARFANGQPLLVTKDQVDLWPLVRRGVFERSAALAFVRRLLYEDGTDLGQQLGFVQHAQAP
jgi:hypothetical protein